MQLLEFAPPVEQVAQLVQIQQLALIASLNIIFQMGYVLFVQLTVPFVRILLIVFLA